MNQPDEIGNLYFQFRLGTSKSSRQHVQRKQLTAMAGVRKYAGLPDLVRPFVHLVSRFLPILTSLLQDPAPDIYETPDLTDDASTNPVKTPLKLDCVIAELVNQEI